MGFLVVCLKKNGSNFDFASSMYAIYLATHAYTPNLDNNNTTNNNNNNSNNTNHNNNNINNTNHNNNNNNNNNNNSYKGGVETL
jgi:hypothetical protein